MKRDEIMAEMIRVAENLERPGLSQAQIERGKAKYETLEEELKDLIEWDRRVAEAKKSKEVERQQGNYTPEVKAAIDRTWKQLDPEGKRRKV